MGLQSYRRLTICRLPLTAQRAKGLMFDGNINGGQYAPYPELSAFLLMWCQLEGLNPDCFYEEPVKTLLREGDGCDTQRKINVYQYGTAELQKKWNDSIRVLPDRGNIRERLL
jgi:hypothetical protein